MSIELYFSKHHRRYQSIVITKSIQSAITALSHFNAINREMTKLETAAGMAVLFRFNAMNC
ncbi:MAG: hypothetical protein GX094_04395 [Clostridiales bacterium]|nr:hypothetical protein [Clostridiales bacterium]